MAPSDGNFGDSAGSPEAGARTADGEPMRSVNGGCYPFDGGQHRRRQVCGAPRPGRRLSGEVSSSWSFGNEIAARFGVVVVIGARVDREAAVRSADRPFSVFIAIKSSHRECRVSAPSPCARLDTVDLGDGVGPALLDVLRDQAGLHAGVADVAERIDSLGLSGRRGAGPASLTGRS